MTPSGIEPATFWLVAQYLNQPHRVPQYNGLYATRIHGVNKIDLWDVTVGGTYN